MAKKRKMTAPEAPVPEEFISRMREQLGGGEGDLLAAALDAPPTASIRINRKKADPATFISRFSDYSPSPVEWCRSGFYLERRPEFVLDPLLHAGVYYVQEAASMVYESLMEEILKEMEGQVRVLDACAAPGGKSTAMLNALEGDYLLVANEFDGSRWKMLKENLDKWGDRQVIVTNSSVSRFAAIGPVFDVVAVDAPCSGEGMMRREPIARTQWNPGLVEKCAALQRDILADAVEALKPGGFLIYSTCTFNTEENEGNVDWLAGRSLSLIGSPRRFMPHRERCEGLFVAVFRKDGELSPSGAMSTEEMGRRLRKNGVRVVGCGIEEMVTKGEMAMPSSRMVLAHDFVSEGMAVVELNRDDALAYLRRNALSLDESVPTGFVTVCHEGYPLGLVKNLGRRANNLYPAEWRVLK